MLEALAPGPNRPCAQWAFLTLCLCLATTRLEALQPTTRLTQYAHRVWRIGDDGLLATPQGVAQTADGYIWITTSNGLFRFDGEHFSGWTPNAGQPLPSNSAWYLLGAGNGSLYVGMDRGLVRITDGQVHTYPGSPRWPGPFVEDKSGTVWMGVSGSASDPSAICKVADESLQCFGSSDGFACLRGLSNTVDANGNLWIGSEEGICRWKPGYPAQNELLAALRREKGLHSITSMATAIDGGLWAGTRLKGDGAGLLHYRDTKWDTYITPAVDGRKLSVSALLAERSGPLWIGTTDDGLYRLVDGYLEHFDMHRGLSDRHVLSIFQDHEGNIWVATPMGIDYFRDYSVLSFTSGEGSLADHANAVATSKNGNVYLGSNTLACLRGHNLAQIKDEHGRLLEDVQFLFRDSVDNIWIAANGRLFVQEREHKIVEIAGYPVSASSYVTYITEGPEHDIWVSTEDLPFRNASLLRIRKAQVLGKYEAASVLRKQVINALAVNPAGGLWLGGSAHGLFWFLSGNFQKVWANGFDDRVEKLLAEPDGALWLVTPHGFLRYAEGRLATLSAANGLPCDDGVNIQDDGRGSKWFYMHCGIMRVSNKTLAAWWSDTKKPVQGTVFNALRGARPNLSNGGPAQTSDGDLWSASDYGFQVIKSDHLPFNSVAPPVQVQRLVADGQILYPAHKLTLPAHTRHVEIDYVGLSYTIPELVRFRYKLLGHEEGWVDAGHRREAFFTDLRPGNYQFKVVACNNDGVWNWKGATLEISIPPAWYQTLLFRFSSALFAVAVVTLAYWYRLRRFEASLRLRFDERLQERTRLARDLHDTLLQTIQGSKMVAENARERPFDPVITRLAFDRLSEWLDRAGREGRAALEALRVTSIEASDLSEALRQVADDCVPSSPIRISSSVTGKVCELHPIVREEVYRIGHEAIRNACEHSGAEELRIDLNYGRHLQLSIRDDGCGIDEETLCRGRAGHFGLIGMRERASNVGGRLTVNSHRTGTVVSVQIPGYVIYKRAPPTSPSWFRKLLRRGLT
jgi:signal transduction histidine kinase/ligand-binding sensor domain-containing protein